MSRVHLALVSSALLALTSGCSAESAPLDAPPSDVAISADVAVASDVASDVAVTVDAPIDGGACPETTPCDDGDACTELDRCIDGECVGTPRVCDAPPLAECVGDTLRTYDEAGECTDGDCRYAPTDEACIEGCVAAPDAHCALPPPRAWTTVSLSSQHVCAVRADGAVYCWGADTTGELGDGTASARHLAPVASMITSGAVDVSCGALFGGHTCAVLTTGRVMCWGEGVSGELGQGVVGSSLTPVEAMGITDAVEVEAGIGFTCVRRATGQVACFGDDTGLGTGAIADSAVPTTIMGLEDVVELSVGDLHACALDGSGHVWCWGYNEDYPLGVDTFGTVRRPVAVPGIDDADRIVAGGGFTCALRGDEVSCWGANDVGQLGGGTVSESSRAPVTQTFVDPTDITAGHSHACVLFGDGSASCWGRNNNGQLGNRSDAASAVPVSVYGLIGAHDIEAGGGTTCAFVGDALSCWGNNYEGMLGIGSRTNALEPVEVWLP